MSSILPLKTLDHKEPIDGDPFCRRGAALAHSLPLEQPCGRAGRVVISRDRLKQVAAYISRMPALSTTATKVLEICNSPSASANDLNRIISYDPVLTGQVIKLINSAYYGLPSRITSLTRAIIMLGLNTVKNLALATSVLGSFKRSRAGRCLPMDAFWEHSLCVGTTAKILAKMKKVSFMEQEEYFVAGLLHDLGKLPLAACFGDIYEAALQRSKGGGKDLFLEENEHIGFNHGHVGLLIGARWKLSKTMQKALAYHHTPLDIQCNEGELLYYTSLADQLAHLYGIGWHDGSPVDEALMKRLAERINVDQTSLSKMKPMIEEEIEKAKIFLNISGKG